MKKQLFLLAFMALSFTVAFAQIPVDGIFRDYDSTKNYISQQFPKNGAPRQPVRFNQVLKGTLDAVKTQTRAYKAITAAGTYAVTTNDFILNVTDNTAGDTIRFTLPTAIGITGKAYQISKSGAAVVIINTTLSQKLENVTAQPATLTFSAVGMKSAYSSGTGWLIQ